MPSLATALNRLFGVGGVKPQLAVKISGQEQAFKDLQALPDKIAMQVMRAATKAALVPAEMAARRAAVAITNPFLDKEHIWETVVTKIKTYRRNELIYGMVGYTAPHAWLVEHGHRMVAGGSVRRGNRSRRDFGTAPKAADSSDTGQGTVVGQVPPHPFLEPAMERAAAEVHDTFIREMQSKTARALKKLGG